MLAAHPGVVATLKVSCRSFSEMLRCGQYIASDLQSLHTWNMSHFGSRLLPKLVTPQTGSSALESTVRPPPRWYREDISCKQPHRSQAALEPSSPLLNLSSRAQVHDCQAFASSSVTGFCATATAASRVVSDRIETFIVDFLDYGQRL